MSAALMLVINESNGRKIRTKKYNNREKMPESVWRTRKIGIEKIVLFDERNAHNTNNIYFDDYHTANRLFLSFDLFYLRAAVFNKLFPFIFVAVDVVASHQFAFVPQI